MVCVPLNAGPSAHPHSHTQLVIGSQDCIDGDRARETGCSVQLASVGVRERESRGTSKTSAVVSCFQDMKKASANVLCINR